MPVGLGLRAAPASAASPVLPVLQRALEHSIQGSGLGLTIVESIVVSHGGDISVVSADGQGTTYTEAVPLKGPQRLSDASQAEPKRSESA
jgi:K+-sensing histidine kinase KdpD